MSDPKAPLVSLLDSLSDEELNELLRLVDQEAAPVISFPDYFDRTTYFAPDPWQINLCQRLDEVAKCKGRRILIHAMPQIGKSSVMQRFAAYMQGIDPTHRVKFACYNIDRAKAHGRVIRDLITDPFFKSTFKHTTFPKLLSGDGWSSHQRLAALDGQYSFQPIGLITGFTGQGVDTLIIDDPYSSAADAYSESYNESIRIFWQDTARPRIINGNVIVMFHRYSEKDFIAMLKEETGEVWEEWRYSAICDDPANDPMGRELGAILSPRFSMEYLQKEQAYSASTFASQFQGIPLPVGGGLIKTALFNECKIEDAPKVKGLFAKPNEEYLRMMVIGVDIAVTAKTSADYTVALPVGITPGEVPDIYVYRPYREQAEWPVARTKIKEFATGMKCKTLAVENIAAQNALVQDLRHSSRLNVMGIAPTKDKEARVRLWLPLLEQSRVFLVEDGSGWTEAFKKECAAFPRGRNDDMVDAFGAALSVIGNGNYGNKMEVTEAYRL